MSQQAKPTTGESIPPSEPSPTSGFWETKDLDRLAAEQGVEPVQDFDRFLDEIGDAWPAEESADEFVAWLRRLRGEGCDR